MGKCGCCSGKHKTISIIGLSLSFFQLILASVYNFHLIGFTFSIGGIISSGLYLHLSIREDDMSKSRSNNASSLDDAERSTNNGEERKELIPEQTGVDIMRAQQVREE